MSRKISKKRKSTSKYRKFKVSPLIPIIAIIEVLVLVVISSYAWFVVVQEKEANTGIITVDADSGLNIDFKNANYRDEINLWDYVPDDFHFSPVTSLDGRNVFVPTSGTFGNNTTNDIVYRDATINDINTKYIDVDFALTNTNNVPVKVYLNDNSRFEVYNGNNRQNSRALRLAFYTNDAKHGNVSSSILANTNNENAALDALDQSVTVYFEKPDNWSNCYAYIWKVVSGTTYVSVSWPGSKMTHVAGKVYSYSFSNKDNYTKIIFSNGKKENPVIYNGSNESTCTQTRDLTISNGKEYKITETAGGTGSDYTTKTVYFLKPDSWSGVRAHAFKASGDSTSFTTYPGDECTYLGANVYSYTFPTTYNSDTMGGIVFNNLANQNQQTYDLAATANSFYYWNGTTTNSGGKTYYSCATALTYTENTVYFNNTLDWKKPYVKITARNNQVTRVAMTNLSAGVYYATIPNAYDRISFEDRDGMNNNTTNQTTKYKYTQRVTYTDGNIYRPNVWTNTGYDFTTFSYTDTVGGSETYAVISPGVSAGFQRAYTPVVGVAANTGAPLEVVPAFASSLDNYIMRSGREMFIIPANGVLDLSMIIWLEGTDSDCTNTKYEAKDIDLYLEFSTQKYNGTSYVDDITQEVDNAEYYTYRFYDKTRECWTSDRLTNEAGVSVAPVIQLYDATKNRGYLMHAASTTNIGGTRKIDLWECQAPATLYTGSDNSNVSHDLYFRRVDPYNEDEVWNYWHPINARNGDNNTGALQTIDGKGYVSFTAFSDGAPASSAESGIAGNDRTLSAATDADTPAQSCGGLWGKHETKLLTVVDGTNGAWLKGDNGDGVVTMNYTYTYSGGLTQAIEYKASGPFYNQLYYFVVPTGIINNSSYTSFKFHRFWGFNTEYAMNIYHRNDDMDYNNTCLFQISEKMHAPYAKLSKTPSGTDQSWFGKDLLYVNISYKDSNGNNNIFNGNTIKFKCRYVASNNSTVLDDYLYTNEGTFSLSNFNGYITVVPNSTSRITLARCNTGSTNWSTVYNWLKEDATWASDKHNLVATKWWSSDTSKIDYVYNNDNTTYGWPEIPSVD